MMELLSGNLKSIFRKLKAACNRFLRALKAIQLKWGLKKMQPIDTTHQP